MVNSNKSALGIIFPNSYDALVRIGECTPDGFYSFWQPLPSDRFYFIQYG